MTLARWALLSSLWLALAYVVSGLAPRGAGLLDPVALALVALVPWIVTAAVSEPGEVGAALADACRTRTEGFAPRRRASAELLRSVGGLSLATGLVLAFVSLLLLFQNLTVAPEPGGSVAWVLARLGALCLAPFYGLALRQFLYEPVAGAVEGSRSLGELLAADDES